MASAPPRVTAPEAGRVQPRSAAVGNAGCCLPCPPCRRGRQCYPSALMDPWPPQLFSPAFFTLVKDLVLQGVAAAGVVIAAVGLTTWRSQLRGTVRHDAAFKVLRSAVELRNALRDVRQARVFQLRLDQVTSEEILQNRYQQHRSRAETVFAARDRVQAAELDAAVLFGDEPVRQALAGLYAATSGFTIAFNEYYQQQLQRIGSGERAGEDVRELLHTIYEERADDEFNTRLGAAFQQVREFFTPHLR